MPLILIALTGVLAGCQKAESTTNTDTNRPATPTQPAAEPAKAQVYTCPMHPEVISSTPGKCPQCDMDLVLK
ncbi:MAG: heavy metal-binding domain-containing protein [Planctomycetota bacterium]